MTRRVQLVCLTSHALPCVCRSGPAKEMTLTTRGAFVLVAIFSKRMKLQYTDFQVRHGVRMSEIDVAET